MLNNCQKSFPKSNNTRILSQSDTQFMMLDRITEIHSDGLTGIKQFSHALPYLAIESCAQLGAFHIRYRVGFCRHIFLGKVKHFDLWPTNQLHGIYTITGTCVSESSDAYLYKIQFADNMRSTDGNFLFGAADYDVRFDEKRLKQHYHDMFERLWADQSYISSSLNE